MTRLLKGRRWAGACELLLIAALCPPAGAERAAGTWAPARTDPRRHRITFDLSITGGKKETTNLVWAFPVPAEWPTQTDVKLVSVNAPREARITVSAAKGSFRYALLRAARIRAKQKVEAKVVFDVTLWKLLPDLASARAWVPKRPSQEIRRYLGPTRGIESSHREIRAQAEAILANGPDDPIQQAALLRAWVRNNVKKASVPYRNARQVLRDRKGNCQESTGLFVALSRAAGIPARCVTTIGHAYAEFYVEPWGWLPTETTKLSGFGCRKKHQIILTKGEDHVVGEIGSFRSTFFSGCYRYNGSDPKLDKGISVVALEDETPAPAARPSGFVNSVADTGHQVQVWEVTAPVEEGREYALAAQHAAAGTRGAFHVVVWTDTTGDGKPDTEVGRSKLFRASKAGRWSDWTFAAPATPVFVGMCWPQEDELVFYQKDGGRPKVHEGLGDTVFYSLTFDGMPDQQARRRHTNLRVHVDDRE